LTATNEALEKRVKELEDCTRCELVDASVDIELSKMKDEVRRLQAENSALHSNLHRMYLFNCL